MSRAPRRLGRSTPGDALGWSPGDDEEVAHGVHHGPSRRAVKYSDHRRIKRLRVAPVRCHTPRGHGRSPPGTGTCRDVGRSTLGRAQRRHPLRRRRRIAGGGGNLHDPRCLAREARGRVPDTVYGGTGRRGHVFNGETGISRYGAVLFGHRRKGWCSRHIAHRYRTGGTGIRA